MVDKTLDVKWLEFDMFQPSPSCVELHSNLCVWPSRTSSVSLIRQLTHIFVRWYHKPAGCKTCQWSNEGTKSSLFMIGSANDIHEHVPSLRWTLGRRREDRVPSPTWASPPPWALGTLPRLPVLLLSKEFLGTDSEFVSSGLGCLQYQPSR